MKQITLKTTFNLIIIGAALLMTACGSIAREVVVVTATSTATPLVVTATPEPTAVVAVMVEPAAGIKPGDLVRGNGEAVFYITPAGTRQQVADKETLLAFGWAGQDIVNIADDLLKAFPVADELTRLVYDDQDHLYWVATGRRWQVDEWKKVVERADYSGIEPAHLDRSLQAALPAQAGFSDGMLLRAGHKVFYFNQDGLLPLSGGVGTEAAVLDVPAEMVEAYAQQSQLGQASIKLKADTPAANVRRSPGLQAEVIGTIKNTENIVVAGRTSDGHWLQILYQGRPGWLAADLTVEAVALRLLPIINIAPVATDLPKAEPAAVVEQSTPQPQSLFCTEVPIRGFGQLWHDNPQVKTTIGCADSWQGGEQAARTAVQIFQNGVMVWLQADGFYSDNPIYVFFSDGTFQRFSEMEAADPAQVGSIPAGFYEVGDKFSKVYWEGTGAQVKERLGYAIGKATDSAGAYQLFSNGRMFWLEEIDRIFVVYEYGYFEKNTYQQVHTWHSYEDKF